MGVVSGEEDQPGCCNTPVTSEDIESVTVNIDWLTLFLAKEWSEDTWIDLNVLRDLAQSQHGAREVPWCFQGFNGLQRGCVAMGEREDGTLRQITSAAAQEYTEMVTDLSHLLRPSRLDIAVSLKMRSTRLGIAQSLFSMGKFSSGSRSDRRRRTMFVGDDGGETVYIGSPSSDQRIRVYNKEVESGNDPRYERTWRYEWQFRRRAAQSIWTAIHKTGNAGAQLSRVAQGLLDRERFVPGLRIADVGVSVSKFTKVDKHLEARLNWLAKQVSPTVRELIREGYGPAVLSALGLDKYTEDML